MSDLDQAIISRLANIKGTYERALLLLENPTPLDGAIALVLMDNVLEAAFKLVLDKLEEEGEERGKRDPDFHTLLDKTILVKELGALKNYRLSLLRLRRTRNGFQHHGIIPDLNTVLREYEPLTEHVLKLITTQKFGLRWEDVSLSLLIKDETIRKLYRKAEESFIKGDYVTAAAYSIYTFEVVKTVARIQIFGSGLSSIRSEVKGRQNKESSLVKYLTALDEEMEAFKLGLDYVDLRNYLDVAQYVGVDSILYNISHDTKEEIVIVKFKQELENNVTDTGLLKEWCTNIREPLLKFIIRTEARWRLSLRLLDKLLGSITEGISKFFDDLSRD